MVKRSGVNYSQKITREGAIIYSFLFLSRIRPSQTNWALFQSNQQTGSVTENLQIFDEIPYIRSEAERLKRTGVKIVIALGHSGFIRDVEIAAQIPDISLVVGGHSHSLLYTPKSKYK